MDLIEYPSIHYLTFFITNCLVRGKQRQQNLERLSDTHKSFTHIYKSLQDHPIFGPRQWQLLSVLYQTGGKKHNLFLRQHVKLGSRRLDFVQEEKTIFLGQTTLPLSVALPTVYHNCIQLSLCIRCDL